MKKHGGVYIQFVALCRSKEMQKAPLGAFCITFDLHEAITCLKGYPNGQIH